MHQSPNRPIGAGGLLLAACLLATAASAQTAGSEGLSPTLANIKKTHVVRLGYRESSPPFSFLDQSNRPIGYSLELCEADRRGDRRRGRRSPISRSNTSRSPRTTAFRR